MPQVDKHLDNRIDNGVCSENDEPLQDFKGDLYGNNYKEEDFPGFENPPCIPADKVMMGMDGSPSHLISHPLFSTLSLQTSIRITTDSAGNPLFGFLMIVWIIMQVLHWKTQQKTHQDALLKANFVPNIWAPFAPKADWEIAMWAKIRGPSSTSLFELLNIEGVHVLFSVSAQCDTNYLQAAQYLGPLIQLCK